MHELAIAQNLSAIVLEVAVKENLSRVAKVNITFGQMVQIVPDIFEFAFRESVRDSIASNAELNLEIVPVKMKCRQCGNDFQVKENNFACCNCSSTDLEIVHGNELFINSIEGD